MDHVSESQAIMGQVDRVNRVVDNPPHRLNHICPYFTMFPLDFPLSILQSRGQRGDMVLDPFCGRGTTNFAARLLGLWSLGVDASPVAAAITASKLVSPHVDDILAEARRILARRQPRWIPEGEFWQWAFHPAVLQAVCQLREAFLEDCSTPARVALRGIVLGALHGPKQKTFPSYLSNQCPRTYAPKPAYAVRFWRARQCRPELVDVLAIIERRARRYYAHPLEASGTVRLGDSREAAVLQPVAAGRRFRWVITSPPYYGMRTYLPDQWLRHWFVGGPDVVDYSHRNQLEHSSPDRFADNLRRVWINVRDVCTDDATLVVRFGGIRDRQVDPLTLIRQSLAGSGWRIARIDDAGHAHRGKRQADAFLRRKTPPMAEYDIWAVRE